MRAWLLILGGLIVWAAHFVAIYAIGSVFPGQANARWLVLAATVAAIGGNLAILWRTTGPRADALDGWICSIGRIGAALSILAVVWQTAPAGLL